MKRVALFLLALGVGLSILPADEPASQPTAQPASQPASQPAKKFPWASDWANAPYTPPSTPPKLLPAKKDGADTFPYDLTIAVPAGLTNVEAVCLQSSWTNTTSLRIGGTAVRMIGLSAETDSDGVLLRTEIGASGNLDPRNLLGHFTDFAEMARRRWRESVAPITKEVAAWPVAVEIRLNGVAFGRLKASTKPWVQGQDIVRDFIVLRPLPQQAPGSPPRRWYFPN